MHSVTVRNVDGILIGDKIKVADTAIKRLVGLLGKHQLNAGEGLWIQRSSGIHTFGMSFSIDVIGLDKSLNVVKLWSNLQPCRATTLKWSLYSVIELPAGSNEEADVQVGDLLRIVRNLVPKASDSCLISGA